MRVSAVVFLAVAVANAAPINTATLTKDIQSTLNQLKAEAGPLNKELSALGLGGSEKKIENELESMLTQMDAKNVDLNNLSSFQKELKQFEKELSSATGGSGLGSLGDLGNLGNVNQLETDLTTLEADLDSTLGDDAAPTLLAKRINTPSLGGLSGTEKEVAAEVDSLLSETTDPTLLARGSTLPTGQLETEVDSIVAEAESELGSADTSLPLKRDDTLTQLEAEVDSVVAQAEGEVDGAETTLPLKRDNTLTQVEAEIDSVAAQAEGELESAAPTLLARARISKTISNNLKKLGNSKVGGLGNPIGCAIIKNGECF